MCVCHMESDKLTYLLGYTYKNLKNINSKTQVLCESQLAFFLNLGHRQV